MRVKPAHNSVICEEKEKKSGPPETSKHARPQPIVCPVISQNSERPTEKSICHNSSAPREAPPTASVKPTTTILHKEKESTRWVFESEEYPEAKIASSDRHGGITAQAASVSFVRKGEDCSTFCRKMEEPKLANCQSRLETPLVAFAGVFDGHDGRLASEYCSEGLLQHILIETAQSVAKDKCNKDPQKILKVAYVNAFHNAQTRFGAQDHPPTFQEVNRRGVWRNGRLKRFFCGNKDDSLHGGTTACTLSIYDGTQGPFALVANCGDSRLVTDDGIATSPNTFRAVTRDHRPHDPIERVRLRDCHATVGAASNNKVLRVFPGGLATSRSIGDIGMSTAIVPTPDIYIMPLTEPEMSGEKNGCTSCCRTQRFVLASDGLWDYVNNETVGRLAARDKRSSKDAATRLLKHCLKHGGNRDDVTIMVVDVTTNTTKAISENDV